MMERRGEASLIITFLAVFIVFEFIIVSAGLGTSLRARYTLDHSYSIVMDSPSTAPGPGNITVPLGITNYGPVDGLPVIRFVVFTYGGHQEEFELRLGMLASGGGHLNTTWQKSFGLLDPDDARVFIYMPYS